MILYLTDSGEADGDPGPDRQAEGSGSASGERPVTRRSEGARGQAGESESAGATRSSPATAKQPSGFAAVSLGRCPLCGAEVVEQEKSYGCSGWKDGCQFAIWKKIAGKTIGVRTAQSLLEHGTNGGAQGLRVEGRQALRGAPEARRRARSASISGPDVAAGALEQMSGGQSRRSSHFDHPGPHAG